jgi:hypothetical protein
MVVRKYWKRKGRGVEKERSSARREEGRKDSQIEVRRPVWYQFETKEGERGFWLRP